MFSEGRTSCVISKKGRVKSSRLSLGFRLELILIYRAEVKAHYYFIIRNTK